LALTETLEKIAAAEAAAAQCRWGEVRQHLHSLASAGPPAAVTVDEASARRIRSLQWRAAAFWWQPLRGAGVVLRRTAADDAEFYQRCFADHDFARRYNRQAAWKGDIRRALDNAGAQSPVDAHAIHWLLTDAPGQRLGLASLSSINLANARAEVSIGFPATASPLHGVMAMLLIYDFAFFKARLNKLTSYVYTANPEALHNSLRVGLRLEGELKDHFYLPPGEFVDVHVLGLTRAQLLQDQRLVQMAKRRLGLDWAPSA